MTTTAIRAVGFCAHGSAQGDWAFDFALGLARRNRLQLNVFHFLKDPYEPSDQGTVGLSRVERVRLLVEREKRLRFYYEELLGDYLEVGFRVCEDDEWTELHRCLCKREFQVLVLGYPSYDACFCSKPLEAFAQAFVCPVVLVGPDSPGEYHLNSPAALMADKLGLAELPWTGLAQPAAPIVASPTP
jgi:hypothetical protein